MDIVNNPIPLIKIADKLGLITTGWREHTWKIKHSN